MTNTKTPSSRVTRSSAKASTVPDGNFVERDFWLSQEDHKNGLYQEPEQEADSFEDGYDNDGVNDTIYDGYMDNDDTNFFSNYENNEETLIPQQQDAVDPENQENALNTVDTPVDFNKNLVAAPKFTYAPQLNYARVAKRVDVAKLKSTLWNEFTQQQPSNVAKKTNTFSSLIKNLSKSYPSEALAEVSVPYCFICLLHLANENNLEIQSTDNKDLIIRN